MQVKLSRVILINAKEMDGKPENESTIGQLGKATFILAEISMPLGFGRLSPPPPHRSHRSFEDAHSWRTKNKGQAVTERLANP